jgi:mono/diheme cytochrome c family protein
MRYFYAMKALLKILQASMLLSGLWLLWQGSLFFTNAYQRWQASQPMPGCGTISTNVVKSYQPKDWRYDGKKLFMANCASCHKTNGASSLAGVVPKWPSEAALKQWIRNWTVAANSGEPYARMVAQSSEAAQPVFEHLQPAELDALVDYLRTLE